MTLRKINGRFVLVTLQTWTSHDSAGRNTYRDLVCRNAYQNCLFHGSPKTIWHQELCSKWMNSEEHTKKNKLRCLCSRIVRSLHEPPIWTRAFMELCASAQAFPECNISLWGSELLDANSSTTFNSQHEIVSKYTNLSKSVLKHAKTSLQFFLWIITAFLLAI